MKAKGFTVVKVPMTKEMKAGKAPSSEGIGPLLLAKSEPLIILTYISDDFSSERLGVKRDVSLA